MAVLLLPISYIKASPVSRKERICTNTVTATSRVKYYLTVIASLRLEHARNRRQST
jgi:hypothetical protein